MTGWCRLLCFLPCQRVRRGPAAVKTFGGQDFRQSRLSGGIGCRPGGRPIISQSDKQWETPMATIVGSGEYRYRIIENWAKLPDGWSFKEVAAVGTDRNDNVYVFGRGEHPMMVFDRDGNF